MKVYKLLFIFLLYASSMVSQSRPNIIFIMTDDQSAIIPRNSDDQNQSRPFGFNGDTKVYTPIIDNLASNGIVFNNSYVSTSICTPSRYSILTGKYAGRSEGTNFMNSFPSGTLSRVANNIELEETITNLPRLLQTAGYTTAFIGKSHIIDHDILETYTQGTNDFRAYSKTADPYSTTVSSSMKFNHDKWSNRMKEFGFDHVNAFYPGNLRELFNDDLNIHNVEYKNKAVLDFIENTNEEPFFIYYSETIPHGPAPYLTNNNGYYAGLDSDVNITAEGVLNQDYSYLPSRNQIKNEINELSGKDPRHAWLRWFDHAVGAVVEKLRAKGKLDNTIIVITSDHGDFNKAKATNYEGGTKVPLMVYWPGGITNPRTYGELVQNIDFTPTFLDLAGVNTTGVTLDGKSLKNIITTSSNDPIHDHLFFEIGFSRAIRTKDWKYITVRYDDATNTKIANGDTFNGPNGTQVPLPYYIPNIPLGSLGAASYPLYQEKDQLFDLANDPYETTNLFESNSEKATQMRNLLRSKLLTFPNRPYQEFTNTSIDLTVTAVTSESTSIIGKILAGYQGWFNTPTDGSNRGWNHYEGSNDKFQPGTTTIDFWPDMSEAEPDEKYDTSFTKKDGSVATVFSSTNAKTINRHFKWMNDYGIDGVFFQQFATNLKSNTPVPKANDKKVLDNIIASAKANNNRLVSVMFDLSNANATGTMVDDIKTYWQQLVTEHGLNSNTNKHLVTYNQKPVVALWGVGFNRTDNYTLDDVQALIDYFKNDTVYGGCAVLLGVPTSWRTLNNDATSNTQLHTVIKSADIVHPWTVGRYSSLSSADNHKSIIALDKAWCDAENLLYMPVVFPGFSWHNLKKDQGQVSVLNSTPRLKGDFLWRQFYNAISANVETIYVAMFDEMDEGTCIFKVDDNPPSSNLTQFTNYEGLPSDYYLWLTGEAGKKLKDPLSLSPTKPVYPDLSLSNTYYVINDGDDNNTGTSLGTAFKTVQKAHDKAKDGDRIYIVGAISQTATVAITKSLTFQGISTAVITGSTARLFNVTTASKAISFSDITFQSVVVSATVTGGAILNQNVASDLSFTNCIFSNNTAKAAGGALNVTLGNLTITNCRFSNNSASGNGGAINFTGINLTISGSVFLENSTTAGNGGAIFAVGTLAGVLSVTTSNFSGNSAATSAGTTANGGAISVGNTLRQALISYSTFYNNTADLQGGGLYFTATNATSELKNITCFENKIRSATADAERGGGIRIEGDRPFTIENSLIYGNLTATLATNPLASDLGVASTASTLTLTKSLFGFSTTLDTNDSYETSNTAANLISSSLFYDATSGLVKFGIPTPGDATPIDFGSDGKDAGAWDYLVSITSLTSNGTTVITQGCAGGTLVIKGTNLTGATAVTLNGIAVASFVVTDESTITATLPAGPIAAGAVVVSTPGGIATSTGNFAVNANVTPTFTQVDPICSRGILNALPTTSNNGITGTWSPALNNMATTEYTFTPNEGHCVTVTMTIKVNPETTIGSVTQAQVGGSYTWLYNNVTYTSTTIVAIVDGCNTATLNLTINIDQPGTGSTDGNLESSEPSNTTWNGTAWSYGAPTASIEAIIAGNYSTTTDGAIAAKKLTVNSGVLTVNSGNLTVVNELINNAGPTAVVLENNANLIQGGTTNTNTGNITLKRNSSPLLRLDYTLWSSPVTNAALFLKGFSPNTLDARFYTYNTTFNTGGVNGAFRVVTSPSTANFIAGKGYSIRMPDNASADTPTTYAGEFTGVPNNGDITASLVDGGSAGLRYNLVGNPYPSPISMSTFVTDNTSNIESTLYFWRKTNGSGSAYCTWAPGGGSGTFVTNGNSKAVNPSGIIQTGQGFFVEAKSGATSVSFNNTQRVTNNTGQFFKIKQVAEASKIWLNATNAKGDFSQMAITYFAEATSGVDAFDAKYFNDSPIALTSNINNGEYTIQGRPAFDPTDVVALNFKTDGDGDYTIALDHFEGVFAEGQDVYLVDSKTGTETDLKAGAYAFNATSGADNSRFSLKYQKTLKADAPAFNENSVRVYKNNGILYVNSGNVAISNIKVFDIQGKLITEQKNVKATSAVISNLKATHHVLIVKITSEDKSLVTEKVVN